MLLDERGEAGVKPSVDVSIGDDYDSLAVPTDKTETFWGGGFNLSAKLKANTAARFETKLNYTQQKQSVQRLRSWPY